MDQLPRLRWRAFDGADGAFAHQQGDAPKNPETAVD